MEYNQKLSDFGDLMTVEEFRENVKSGMFIDYDGYGYPVKDNLCAHLQIYPSELYLLPKDATHIHWFNR
jgi:hypothetical protein